MGVFEEGRGRALPLPIAPKEPTESNFIEAPRHRGTLNSTPMGPFKASSVGRPRDQAGWVPPRP